MMMDVACSVGRGKSRNKGDESEQKENGGEGWHDEGKEE